MGQDIVLGIDTGTKRTGAVLVSFVEPHGTAHIHDAFLGTYREIPTWFEYWFLANDQPKLKAVGIEFPVPYGVPASQLFLNAFAVGYLAHFFIDFFQTADFLYLLPRPSIKAALLNTARAKDKDIRDFLKTHVLHEKDPRLRYDVWDALACAYALHRLLKNPTHTFYQLTVEGELKRP